MGGGGGGEEMWAFWAKVVERSGGGCCGGFEAREEKGEVVVGGCWGAKGLATGGWGADEEKGFWLEVFEVKVELKRLSPRFGGCCSCFGGVGTSVTLLFAVDFPAEFLEILTPRIALTVPSFFLQAFLLQLKMYNFRSCPGNFSGRSPFNCSSKVNIPLHILHLASSAEGALVSSSQL